MAQIHSLVCAHQDLQLQEYDSEIWHQDYGLLTPSCLIAEKTSLWTVHCGYCTETGLASTLQAKQPAIQLLGAVGRTAHPSGAQHETLHLFVTSKLNVPPVLPRLKQFWSTYIACPGGLSH